jgi:NAD(P)-dependent dehydrogenase (short-subunit alcohol dehydrogenase family)
MLLDMSTLNSTATFVSQVKSELSEIDIVLLNAGALNTTHHLNEEGYEQTIQVTVLSTALLALLLLPWMKVAGKGKAHLGFVTSGLHRTASIDTWPRENVLQWLSQKENWPASMYATAKLLEQFVANELRNWQLAQTEAPRLL